VDLGVGHITGSGFSQGFQKCDQHLEVMSFWPSLEQREAHSIQFALELTWLGTGIELGLGSNCAGKLFFLCVHGSQIH
jgi:hypothetical protein